MNTQDIADAWIDGMNVQDITETYHREQRKYGAAKEVYVSIQEGYKLGTVNVLEFSNAVGEHDLALRRFEKAREAMKKIPAAPPVESDQEITPEDAPATMPVMLTEYQLGLLKACIIEQRKSLSEGIMHPQVHKGTCLEQIKECGELHNILAEGQLAFVKARRDKRDISQFEHSVARKVWNEVSYD